MNKKAIVLWLAFVLLSGLSMAGCSRNKEIVFLHVNDTHSQMLPFESDEAEVGGIARRIALVKDYESNYRNVVLIDAGGAMTGSAYCSYYEGEMDIELMNRMGVDFMVVGHHELDFGYDKIMEWQEQANFPFLSANIISLETGDYAFQPYVISNIGGFDIAFIGLCTSDWSIINQKMKDYIEITDESETLKALFEETEIEESCDLIVLLSHAGYNKDLELAKEFSEIDVIFSGNGDFLTVYPEEVDDCLVLQAGERGEYVGVLTYENDKGELGNYSYELIRLTDEMEEDEETVVFIEEKTEDLERWLETIVCESHFELDNEGIREYSTPEGNFIADIYRDISGADFAIVNAGSIRASIPEGYVSLGDLYEVVPYDNVLMNVTVPGSVVSNVISKGLKKRYKGAFLQMSSELKVTVGPGSRLSITVNDKPLKMNTLYTVAISDFMYLGGDDYDDFTNNTEVVNTGYLMREAIKTRLESMTQIYRENMDFYERIVYEED